MSNCLSYSSIYQSVRFSSPFSETKENRRDGIDESQNTLQEDLVNVCLNVSFLMYIIFFNVCYIHVFDKIVVCKYASVA